MSKVNRPPIGLQHFLGSQNFGSNPSELSGAIAPTLDMFPFMANQDLYSNVASLTGVKVDSVMTVTTFLVPQNEIWLAVAAAVHITGASLGVGDQVTVAPSLTQVQNSNSPPSKHGIPFTAKSEYTVASASAALVESHGMFFPSPYFMMRSNEQIVWDVSNVVAAGLATWDLRFTIRYFKLRI